MHGGDSHHTSHHDELSIFNRKITQGMTGVNDIMCTDVCVTVPCVEESDATVVTASGGGAVGQWERLRSGQVTVACSTV